MAAWPSENRQGSITQALEDIQVLLSGANQQSPAEVNFDPDFFDFEQAHRNMVFNNNTALLPTQNSIQAESTVHDTSDFGGSSNSNVSGVRSDHHSSGPLVTPRIGNGTVLRAPMGAVQRPIASQPAVERHEGYSIHVPTDIADHLYVRPAMCRDVMLIKGRLELYFEKVQPALPLLHRPGVYALFHGNKNREDRYRLLDPESALLLNGMFALSARFSRRDDFWACDLKARGERFAKQAQTFIDREHWMAGESALSLRYLQGCILLAYYQVTLRPSVHAWLQVAVCCRCAYALNLHQTDREDEMLDMDSGDSAEAWSVKEAQRRAWWIIWLMDNFASTIAGRPFSIDMLRVEVCLPVSDEAWFSLRPVQSAVISSKGPSEAWKALQNSENQESFSWFLISNYLHRSAQDEFEKREPSIERLKILQSSIQCFALSLPSKLRLSGDNMAFQENNFGEKNWIIATHLMMQG